jgi:histidinol dehydrogenase
VLGARPWIEQVDSLDAAINRANEIAPEHVLLALEGAEEAASRIRSAGTVFVGQTSSNAFGDYMTGANHVLPTGGLARSYSGLSTLDFIRWTTIQTVTEDAARSLAPDVARFAEAEGLPGHAIAARVAGGLQGRSFAGTRCATFACIRRSRRPRST